MRRRAAAAQAPEPLHPLAAVHEAMLEAFLKAWDAENDRGAERWERQTQGAPFLPEGTSARELADPG